LNLGHQVVSIPNISCGSGKFSLETAESLEDMDLPGLELHQLRGNRKGIWAVKVSGNWCITFRIRNGDAFDVNYEDYH
jgi:proteic killer suppression protein